MTEIGPRTLTEEQSQRANVREALDELLVGQERAKRSLSLLVEMHESWFGSQDRLHRAPNALLIGPTGTGKSHAIRVAANALNLPLVVVDSTRLVAAVATEQVTLEKVIEQLVASARALAAEKRLGEKQTIRQSAEAAAERGIVFLDEFDKLSTKDMNSASAAIQRRLLQFIEGETVFINMTDNSNPRFVHTHGMLFIAAGAFSGIQGTGVMTERDQRTIRDPSLGQNLQPTDVVSFGFLQELVARMPVIIRFDKLNTADLMRILDHDEVSPLNFYLRYFAQQGKTLTLPLETRDYIATEAFENGLGARSLHQELFPPLSALAEDVRDGAHADRQELILTLDRFRALRKKANNEGNTS